MSQSRFSIVLVGVSALLRRPLVSRLRPADGERSPWVVFTARGCRFDSGFRSAGWPSGSLLPLFGMRRFGNCPRRVDSSAFCFGDSVRRVGLRAHRFRFSIRTASELPLGEFVLPPSVSEITAGRVGLRVHRFRFSARTVSELPFGELAFGLIASAFRHAPLRSGRSAGWPSGSLLPLFGTHRFGVALGGLVLPPSVSEIAAGRAGASAFRFRFSACTDPHRRTAEARTDGAHRHDNCFTSKHLSQHVNLPHRTP